MAATVDRYDMLQEDDKVVVAVSGGPDSTCLLDVLARLRPELTLVVAHVDHGLSDASEGIANDVARVAAERGFDVHVARARDLEGPNLHARARDFRYAFFAAIADDEGASCIATGHTLDDRVETTLARFLHGAGTATLAGIPPVGRVARTGTRLVRPLIDGRRAETRVYCEEAGLLFVDDPSNEDPRFERPSVRHLVLAPIEQRWGDGAVRAMATSIERLREDSVALERQAGLLYDGVAEAGEGGAIRFDLQTLLAMPRALRRRMLERAVGRVRDRGAGIDEALDSLDRSDRKPGARFDVASGIRIVISDTVVAVEKPSAEDGPLEAGPA